MKINQLDHYNFYTDNPDGTIHFYTEILGLENSPEGMRQSNTPGAWIMIGERPAIHINFVEKLSTARLNGDTGVIDHIAFDASGYEAFEALFKSAAIKYRKVARPEMNLVQLFLHDPNGIKIEMNIRDEL